MSKKVSNLKTLDKKDANRDKQLSQQISSLHKEIKKFSLGAAKTSATQRAVKRAAMIYDKVPTQAEASQIIRRAKAAPPPRSLAENTVRSNALKSRLKTALSGGWKTLNPTSMADFKANSYLKALVDPEHCGLGVGVPDSHVDPTYRYQSIIERNIGEFGSGTDTPYSSDGYLPIVTCPDARTTLILPGTIPAATMITYIDYERCGVKLRDLTFADTYNSELPNTEASRITKSTQIKYGVDELDSFLLSYINKASQDNQTARGSNGLGGAWPVETSSDAAFQPGGLSGSFGPGRHVPNSIGFTTAANYSMWDPGLAGNGEIFSFPYSVNTVDGQQIAVGANLGGQSEFYVTVDCAGSISMDPRVQFPGALINLGYALVLTIEGYTFDGNACTGSALIGMDFPSELLPTDPSNVVLGHYAYSPFTAGGYSKMTMFKSGTPVDPGQGVHLVRWCITPTFYEPLGGVPATNFNFYNPVGAPDAFSMIDFSRLKISLACNSPLTPSTTSNTGLVTSYGIGAFMHCHSMPEYDVYNDGLTAGIRLVSMSTWIQYLGSDLDNSGAIYGSYIADRRLPADRDHSYLTPYALNTTGFAYKGRLSDGIYQIWKPESDRDLAFKPFDSLFNFNKTYNVALVFQPSFASGSGGQLSIRFVGNWEIITYSPIYRNNLQESVVAPQQIIHVFQALSGFPMSMENTTHTTTISSFFSDLWGGIKSAASGLWSDIAPAVGSRLSSWITAL